MGSIPGRYVDLARYGVADSDLRRSGDRAVYNALVRVAMSAANAGWDYGQFAVFIADPRSNLGQQARMRHGKPVDTSRYERMLRAAWTKGVERVQENPRISKLDIDEQVRDLRLALEDADTDLDANERAVLAHACDIATKIGTLTPAMPWRDVRDATGLGEKATKSAIARLERRGLLRVASRGRRGANSGKATCYHLPLAEHLSERLPLDGTPVAAAPYSVPETGPMGPPGQTYGTPPDDEVGTPGQTYGTPPQEIVPETGHETPVAVENAPMSQPADQTATVKMDPAMLAAFMDFYAQQQAKRTDDGALPDNVIPFRRRADG